MQYYWLIIIVLCALILIAVDPRSWGQWAREGWTDLGLKLYGRRESDIEVRAKYRRIALEHIPTVSDDAIPGFSDPTLDRLIFEDRFDEANRYRMEQLKLARERKDAEGVETYSIYKNILSKREAAFDENQRRHVRDKYPRPKRNESVSDPVDDPMEIAEPHLQEKKRKKTRSGFIEIEWKGLPIRPPLHKDEVKEVKPEFLGEKISSKQAEFKREQDREPAIKPYEEPVVQREPEPATEPQPEESMQEPEVPETSQPAEPDSEPTPIDGFVNENDISSDDDEFTGLIQV